MGAADARLCRHGRGVAAQPPGAAASCGPGDALTRLLFVHAVDLDADRLHRLIDAGRLPDLARLVEQGTIASIDVTGQPAAVVWAGMATGRWPSGHGIHGDYEVRPDGGGIQPYGATAWRVAPVWRMLADRGVATAIVSLPGTSPAAAWPGMVAIDERFALAPPYDTLEWPLAPACIEPHGLRSRLRGLRLDPEDLDPEQTGALSARPLAYAATVQGIALDLAARRDWRLLALCFPPLGDSDEAARFLDMAIGRLVAVAGEDASILVTSSTGMVIARGPRFAADRLRHGIRTVDVAATILSLYGLTLEEGDGRSFAEPSPAPARPVSGALPPRDDQDERPPVPEEALSLIAEVERHRMRVSALEAVHVEGPVAAMPALRAALDRNPDDIDLRIALGQGAALAGDADTCLELGAWFARALPDSAWSDMLVGAALVWRGDAAADAHLATAAARGADDAGVLTRLGAIALQRHRTDDARSLYQASLAVARGDVMRARGLAGLGLALLDNDPVAAEANLRAALGLVYDAAGVHHQLGLLLLRQRRWSEALASLGSAARLSPGDRTFRADLRRAENAVAAGISRTAG